MPCISKEERNETLCTDIKIESYFNQSGKLYFSVAIVNSVSYDNFICGILQNWNVIGPAYLLWASFQS